MHTKPHHFFRVFGRAALLWNDRGASALSAAVSYYMIFAITPFLLLVVSFMSLLYGATFVTAAFASWQKMLGPDMIKLLLISVQNLEHITNGYTIPLIGALFFSTMVITALNTFANGLQQLWDRPQFGVWPWVKQSLRSFLFIGILVIYLIVLLLGNKLVALAFVQAGAATLAIAYALVFILLTTVLFVATLGVLPVEAPRYHARVWGGLVASILLYSVKTFVSLYLLVTPTPGLFGTAGVVLVFLIWSYASVAVVFYGATIAYVLDPLPPRQSQSVLQ